MTRTLADKITDRDDPLIQGSADRRSLPNLKGGNISAPWWLHREHLRAKAGIYPMPTAVLSGIQAQLPQFGLHVSKEDEKLIAFTPDKSYGEADRQVRTTLGRFLAKYAPHLPDHVAAELCANHLAELDPYFEILRGEAIVEAYLSGQAGACMSKSHGAYSYGNPTAVYDMPNIGMAVLRDSEGKINGRSMIYTPSETDKRFIRVYNSELLRNKLQRAGYKAGTWVGAEFKLIRPVPEDPGVFVIPYLDGNDTVGNAQVSSVAIVCGKLVCVGSAIQQKIRCIGAMHIYCSTNTGGQGRALELTAEKVGGICGATGKLYNVLYDVTVPYWDGEPKRALETEVVDWPYLRVYTNGRTTAYSVRAGTPSFTSGGWDYVDNAETREVCGFRRLSPKYYPDSAGWVEGHINTPPSVWVKTSEGYILTADAVYKCVSGREPEAIHHQEVQQDWVKVHAPQRGKLYFAPNPAEVRVTVNGRKVVEDCHKVGKTYRGTWDFRVNLLRCAMLGKEVFFSKGEAAPTWDSEYGQACIEEFVSSYKLLDVGAVTLASRFISRYIEVNGSYIYNIPPHKAPAWKDIRRHSSIQSSDLGKALDYFMLTRQAEMNALDYSLAQPAGPAPRTAAEAAEDQLLEDLGVVNTTAAVETEAVNLGAPPWAPSVAADDRLSGHIWTPVASDPATYNLTTAYSGAVATVANTY